MAEAFGFDLRSFLNLGSSIYFGGKQVVSDNVEYFESTLIYLALVCDYDTEEFLALGRALLEDELPPESLGNAISPFCPDWLGDLLSALASLDENGQKVVQAVVNAFNK